MSYYLFRFLTPSVNYLNEEKCEIQKISEQETMCSTSGLLLVMHRDEKSAMHSSITQSLQKEKVKKKKIIKLIPFLILHLSRAISLVLFNIQIKKTNFRTYVLLLMKKVR